MKSLLRTAIEEEKLKQKFMAKAGIRLTNGQRDRLLFQMFMRLEKLEGDLQQEQGMRPPSQRLEVNPLNVFQVMTSVICDVFSLTHALLMSNARPDAVAFPRMLAMYLLHLHFNWKAEMCEDWFHKSSGTAAHAFKVVAERLETSTKEYDLADRVMNQVWNLLECKEGQGGGN